MVENYWTNPPTILHLPENEIHLWLCKFEHLKSSVKFLNGILSSDQKKKASKFVFEKDRISYIISNGLLRKLLASYTGISMMNIKFIYNDFGKPLLINNNNIKFNLSHSNEYCLIGINRNDNIGVDIEWINKNIAIDDIAGNYFSNNEINKFNSVKPNHKITSFYKIWTRKEAFIKAVGKGLSIPLNSFDVDLDDMHPKVNRIEGKEDLTKYNLYNIYINKSYCAAAMNIGQPKHLNKYFIKNISQV